MASSFTWVDFSEEDRHRIKEVLYLFRDREIREELGVGTVRDAISDILFPGTSTLHTRAKYMLFIPWIFMEREKRRTSSQKIEEESRMDELALSSFLKDAGETDGVIGMVAGQSLKILPSYMYWSGLGIWGIRKFEGSINQYFRSLDQYYIYLDSAVRSETEQMHPNIRSNWDPNIVKPSAGFPKKPTLNLTYDEAEYLRDKIKTNCRNSLLAFLVSETESVNIDFIWEHPQFGHFNKEHKNIVRHARNFSEVIHGASLLYNFMLSQEIEQSEWIDKYKKKIKSWDNEIKSRFHEIANWDLNEFWEIIFNQNNQIPRLTKRFIEQWINQVHTKKNLARIHDDQKAKSLIYNREVRIKGNRSRLKNKSMLSKWAGAAGAYKLNFRWRIVQRIVNDILKGLQGT